MRMVLLFISSYLSLQEERPRDQTIKLLLSYGADINAADDSGRTALSYAVEKKCNDVVKIFVQHPSVDPDIPDDNGGYSYKTKARQS